MPRDLRGCALPVVGPHVLFTTDTGIPSTTVTNVSLYAPVCQPCLTLCNPMDCSLPGSSVHGISQARILECVAISYSRGSSRPKDRTQVSFVSSIVRWIFTTEPPGKPIVLFNSEVVSDSLWPLDCSPPCSSVHGILQARILEWVAISFSRKPILGPKRDQALKLTLLYF